MSVIIKGMEIPKNCSDCGQFFWNNYLQCDVCRIAVAIGDKGFVLVHGRFQSEDEGIENRPSWCPLEDAEEIYMNHYIQGRMDERAIKKRIYAVKGKWNLLFLVDNEQTYGYECSNCKTISGRKSKFCPNCGADMRGVE